MYNIWDKVSKSVHNSGFRTEDLKDIAIKTLVNFAVLVTLEGIYQYTKDYTIAPKNQVVQKIQIDKDELSDLVIGERIFLADRVNGKIAYHELESSDIYRIR